MPSPPEAARVLLVGPATPWLEEQLRQRYRVVLCPEGEADRDAFLGRLGGTIEVAVVVRVAPFPVELMARLPNLRLVANFGAGYDNVDVAEAHRRGVVVTFTPEVANDAVAEVAVGLILSCVRHIPAADRYVRSGRWLAEGIMPFRRQLSSLTVGILGLGRIGREVANRLEPFGCQIEYLRTDHECRQELPISAPADNDSGHASPWTPDRGPV